VDGTTYRLEFKAASEVEAFTRAFPGHMIGVERTGTVAA